MSIEAILSIVGLIIGACIALPLFRGSSARRTFRLHRQPPIEPSKMMPLHDAVNERLAERPQEPTRRDAAALLREIDAKQAKKKAEALAEAERESK